MAERGRYPSLPASYVSIVDLQERWMKRQQEKEQKQKEEKQQQQQQQELQQKLREQEVKQEVAEATRVEHEDHALIEASSKRNPKPRIQNSIDRRKQLGKFHPVKGRTEHLQQKLREQEVKQEVAEATRVEHEDHALIEASSKRNPKPRIQNSIDRRKQLGKFHPVKGHTEHLQQKLREQEVKQEVAEATRVEHEDHALIEASSKRNPKPRIQNSIDRRKQLGKFHPVKGRTEHLQQKLREQEVKQEVAEATRVEHEDHALIEASSKRNPKPRIQNSIDRRKQLGKFHPVKGHTEHLQQKLREQEVKQEVAEATRVEHEDHALIEASSKRNPKPRIQNSIDRRKQLGKFHPVKGHTEHLQQKLREQEVKQEVAEATRVEHEDHALIEASSKRNPKPWIQNSIDRRKQLGKFYPVKGRTEHRVVKVSNPKPEESEIRAAVAISGEIHDEVDQKVCELKAKGKKKKAWIKKFKKARVKKEDHLKEGNVKSIVSENVVEVEALKSLKEVEAAAEKDVLVPARSGDVEPERQNAEGEGKILEKDVGDRTPEIGHKFEYVQKNKGRITEAGRRFKDFKENGDGVDESGWGLNGTDRNGDGVTESCRRFNGIRRKGDGVAGTGWRLKGIPRNVTSAGEIGSRLKDLSVNCDSNGAIRRRFNGLWEKGIRERTTRSSSVTYEHIRRDRRYGGHRMFVHRNPGDKKVGSGLAWVRKGEASEIAEA
ncbi:hypothetical protein Ancab_016553 [Ancistrocladus abbreviatus]